MTDAQQPSDDDLKIQQLVSDFLSADTQEEQELIAANPDILLSDEMIFSLRDYIFDLERKLALLKDLQKEYIATLEQSEESYQQEAGEDVPNKLSPGVQSATSTVHTQSTTSGQTTSDPRMNIPQQPYIPRSEAETEAMMRSWANERLESTSQMLHHLSEAELTQIFQMLGDVDNPQVTPLFQMVGQANQMSSMQIHILRSLMQQFQDLSPEEKQQIVRHIKASSPEQIRAGAEEFKAATQHIGTEQVAQSFQNMSQEEFEALLETMVKKGYIHEGQKGSMRLSFQQVQAVSTNQVKYAIDNVLKMQQAGESIDARRIQGLEIPLMQNIFRTMQDPERAIETCTQELATLSREQNPFHWAMTHCLRGAAYYDSTVGDHNTNIERALTDFNTALTILTPNNYPAEWGSVLMMRASLYMERKQEHPAENRQKAATDCEAAMRLFPRETFPEQWAQVANHLAALRVDLGQGDLRENIEQSLHDQYNVIDVLHKETQLEEWVNAHLSCAALNLKRIAGDQRTNWKTAYHHCNQVLEVLHKDQNPVSWGRALILRGFASYHKLPKEVPHILENRIGIVQFVAHDLGNVLQCFKSSIEIYREACDDFNMALTVLTKENAPDVWALAHAARAGAYEIMNIQNSKVYTEQANKDYEIAQTVFTPESMPLEWAAMQSQQATLLLLSPTNQTTETIKLNAQKSLQYIDAALRVYTAEVSARYYLYTRVMEAIAHERISNWEKAHSAWLEVRKVRRTITATALNEQIHTDQEIILMNINIYKHDAQVLLRCTPPDMVEAVISLEEGRAQGLRLAFDLDSLDPQKVENPLAKKRIETLLAARKVRQYCQDRMEQLLRKDTVEVNEERHQCMQELQRSHDDIIQAVNAIRAYDNPDFMSPVPTFASIVQAISIPDEALVYLVAGSYFGSSAIDNGFVGADADRGLAICVMRDAQGEPRVHALNLPLLTGLAMDGLFLQETPSDSTTHINVERTIKQAGELGMNDLVVMLQQWGIRKVTFIPYGRLSLFPLAAIQVQNAKGKTTYLGDLFEVSTAPSARSHEVSRRRASEAIQYQQRQGLCFVGNPYPLADDTREPLPLAEAEADIIRNVARAYDYPSARIRHLSRREATKQLVVEGLHMARYAHLAMHGTYNVNNPLGSHLHLAGNRSVQEQERTITLGEVLQGAISLSGLRLLVLSACDTSLIDLHHAPDEVLSLAAGFLQAGVAGVIASLWRVDDAAACLLMVRFAYHYLDPQGIWSPVRALTEAQRWLREEATNRVLSTYDPLEDLLIPSLMPEESQKLYNKTIAKIRRQAMTQLETAPNACPYAHPKYWAAFMLTGC